MPREYKQYLEDILTGIERIKEYPLVVKQNSLICEMALLRFLQLSVTYKVS